MRRRRGDWHNWPFEPLPVLRALGARGVDYILIGGLAAVLQGSPLPTYDIDLAPAASVRNRDLLAAALADLGARTIVKTKSKSVLTPYGYVDLHFAVAGFDTYASLRRNAVGVDLEPGLRVLASPLRDIIRSRAAAGDTRQLPALLATLEAPR
ncbi:MAG: nucleotidyltransferase domain-containing protein [Mycobacteriales bacterium]